MLYLTALEMKVNKPWLMVVLLISAVASIKQKSSSEITWVTSTAFFSFLGDQGAYKGLLMNLAIT